MLVYGKNVFKEMDIKSVNKIYLVENFNDQQLLKKINKKKTMYLSKSEMDKLVKGNHQGIIGEIPDYQYYDLDDLLVKEQPFLVMLDHLEDPHNFGAINSLVLTICWSPSIPMIKTCYFIIVSITLE